MASISGPRKFFHLTHQIGTPWNHNDNVI